MMIMMPPSSSSLCLLRAGRAALMAVTGGRCRLGVRSLSGGPVKLTVKPLKSLADEPLAIEVEGLGPEQAVTLRAQVLTEQGEIFLSCGQYRADGDGRVDVGRSPSLGGNYEGVAPMGLLWTLAPAPMERPYQKLSQAHLTGSPMFVDLRVHSGHTGKNNIPGPALAYQRFERWFSKPGLRRIRLREGNVRGSIFIPTGDGPFPGVIDLFGDGGLIEFRACLLASRGFATLALPYFGFEDLPISMTDFHLEYFEEAVNYLKKHPKVKGPGIGVIGSSKGGDLALSMVTFLPQVVASVCISGCHANTMTDLHYKGIHLLSLSYDVDRIVVLDSGILDMSETLENPSTNKGSIIPLEKAEGHILFVVGEGDKIWNSKQFADEAIKRLKKNGKDNYKLLSYPGAGHCIEPPCSPFRPAKIDRLYGLPVLLGGEALKHCSAQQDAWEKIQDFLRLHLG
ncbi:acyl-coenzyme A amino acid N-acyltransferase 1-like [Stegostoma tigrinum]|uniref:acyl-coenzyme A amino acid N-acyltransferase 1-like n=1 Tax=Stegostoma tigrinum TaxID=3053191 RepID=UPI00287069D6|nr:acyl-coenzyme A amino acid N-acyltransferase 1-like [Stegostoma tigrinum]